VRGIHGALSGPVSGDFARAFGFRATSEGVEQLYLASKLVLDSRAAGAMYPIAGIFGTPMDDLAATERLIRRARDIGYTGVAVMHPSHVAIANTVFRPTAEEIAYFEGLLKAFEDAEKSGLGAVKYQGAMVDYAMLPLAREVLAEAGRHFGQT
jgi:citrate lyase subunit beta/citryl-CoA lyase